MRCAPCAPFSERDKVSEKNRLFPCGTGGVCSGEFEPCGAGEKRERPSTNIAARDNGNFAFVQTNRTAARDRPSEKQTFSAAIEAREIERECV